MRLFPGKFFELKLSNMHPHELASLSRLRVRAFILLLFGAGGRAFGRKPGRARHYVSSRLFPRFGKNVVLVDPCPCPVSPSVPTTVLLVSSSRSRRRHTTGLAELLGRQMLYPALSSRLRSKSNLPAIPLPRASLNGLRIVNGWNSVGSALVTVPPLPAVMYQTR